MTKLGCSRAAGLLLGAVLIAGPVLAQTGEGRAAETEALPIERVGVDIVGSWTTMHTEDLWERRSGLEVGDFTGVALNAAGRMAGAAWDPGWFSIPEEQCRVHTGIYGPRGPWDVTIE